MLTNAPGDPPRDPDPRVLLVEGDPHYADLVAKILSSKPGFGEIRQARTLGEASGALETVPFALVFLEMNLSDSRGLPTLAKVRATAGDANILVMTSVINEDLAVQALREGADDYFVKGYVPPEGLRRIARYSLERRAVALAMRKTRDEMEVQLRHAERMRSIGQLAAGIAHEINTPIQFVGDNCRFLEQSFSELLPLLVDLEGACRAGGPGGEGAESLRERLAAADLPYYQAEIPQAIRQSLEGLARVAGIISAMKDFSHPGETRRQIVDLNRIIESALTVSRAAWHGVSDVITRLDPDLPLVSCYPGDLGQAILNLVINAAQAIEERQARSGRPDRGAITVATRRVGEFVELEVADDGAGIPLEIQTHIFDPFFTTKPVGKGTGQGLSIVHGVVVDRHGGRIHLRSEPGLGTTFTLVLPLSCCAG